MHLYRSNETEQTLSRSEWRRGAITARIWLLPAFACLLSAVANAQQQAPELFTYNELVQLYDQDTPPANLQDKLHRFLTTPFVNNAASARGVKPLLPNSTKLGKFLRVV